MTFKTLDGAGLIAELVLVFLQLEQAGGAARAETLVMMQQGFGGQGCLLDALENISLLDLLPHFPSQRNAFLWLMAQPSPCAGF